MNDPEIQLSSVDGDFLALSKLVVEFNEQRTTIIRLSAEREKERRVEQCCECNAYVSDWVEAEHRNGRICRPCESLISVRATLAERDRQLAESERALEMATDAANKGDEARCKAGAMQDMIDDLQRQKAELEGGLKVAEDSLFACRTIADGCQQYDGRFERIIIEADHAIQSLRQSTQTEEEK